MTGIQNGSFHNIAMLLLNTGVVTLMLQVVRYKYLDSFLFAGIGFEAHIFEYARLFKPGCRYLWPGEA
jgi:hypothetical protein